MIKNNVVYRDIDLYKIKEEYLAITYNNLFYDINSLSLIDKTEAELTSESLEAEKVACSCQKHPRDVKVYKQHLILTNNTIITRFESSLKNIYDILISVNRYSYDHTDARDILRDDTLSKGKKFFKLKCIF